MLNPTSGRDKLEIVENTPSAPPTLPSPPTFSLLVPSNSSPLPFQFPSLSSSAKPPTRLSCPSPRQSPPNLSPRYHFPIPSAPSPPPFNSLPSHLPYPSTLSPFIPNSLSPHTHPRYPETGNARPILYQERRGDDSTPTALHERERERVGKEERKIREELGCLGR